MHPRSAALLWDALSATRLIRDFVAGKTWDDYTDDELLRSAVERQFEIAGEAMSVLRRIDRATANCVPNAHKIIGMRNILIHGYAEVNDATVWQTATNDIDVLIDAIDTLLTEADPPGTHD